jgi:polyhydroxybutyrate depolymerase
MLVGADDHTVPGAGGPLGGAARRGTAPAEDHDVAPARAAADYWARANGCDAAPTTTQLPNSVRTAWTRCRGGADVVFEVVAKNGHAWPGGRPGREGADPPNPDFNASDAIWAFFKAHPRKPR